MQTRSDREKYVNINYDNIKPEKFKQYNKCTACSLSKTPYDCQSIMHYPSHHNAINPFIPTITPVDRSSCKLSKDMRTKKATKHDWDSLRDHQYHDVKNNKTL